MWQEILNNPPKPENSCSQLDHPTAQSDKTGRVRCLVFRHCGNRPWTKGTSFGGYCARGPMEEGRGWAAGFPSYHDTHCNKSKAPRYPNPKSPSPLRRLRKWERWKNGERRGEMGGNGGKCTQQQGSAGEKTLSIPIPILIPIPPAILCPCHHHNPYRKQTVKYNAALGWAGFRLRGGGGYSPLASPPPQKARLTPPPKSYRG